MKAVFFALCVAVLCACGCSREVSPAATFDKHYDLAYKYFNQAQGNLNANPRAAYDLYGKGYEEAKAAIAAAPKDMPKTTWIRYQKMLEVANECMDKQEMLQRKIR
jgi:hypothetical protein